MTRELLMAPLPELARLLASSDLTNLLVIALPPGGLVPAMRLSGLLGAPVDVLLVQDTGPDSELAPAERSGRWPMLAGRSIVLVDDGSADAAALAAALAALRAMGAVRLIVAVAEPPPIAPAQHPPLTLTSRVRLVERPAAAHSKETIA
ncbi:phosphoribosyltransferase [Aquincola sp. S2]|uniref:Phosphoribosyltransferase n=1 Tax=Pseudaquabacterium terrae TaxID=2732868 RepID=A0ABX2EIL7_9BURK|nr:phosphoribosyltransferase [Aquabacterium terrae]NRF68459.1 phosphoribosyltransferase [Aquabacterium terrae]